MNLIETSKNKNQFLLKKSQRTVEVVLTLFLFYQYLLGNKSKRKQKNNHEHKQKTILGKIVLRGWLRQNTLKRPTNSRLRGCARRCCGGWF